MMAPIEIHLKSISCKGVRNPIQFQKPSIYAVVSIADDQDPPNREQRHKTPVDRTGGENPEWDHPMRFALDGGYRGSFYLRFDLKAQGGLLLLADKLVGVVHVPLADLCEEGTGGSVRHVSYQVRAPDGKPNGVLRFSYELNYPPEREAEVIRSRPPDPAVLSPPFNLYPKLDFSPDPAVSSSPVGLYPRLDISPDLNVYRPPAPAVYTPIAAVCSEPSSIPYFPAPEPAAWWPVDRSIGGEWYPPPPPVAAAYYPPPQPADWYPPPPPVAAAYYPPPQPTDWCPPPAGPYGSGSSGWDRGMHGY